jgi:hypothetical protein
LNTRSLSKPEFQRGRICEAVNASIRGMTRAMVYWVSLGAVLRAVA